MLKKIENKLFRMFEKNCPKNIGKKLSKKVQKGCWRKNVGTYIKKYSNNFTYKNLSLTTLKGIEEQRSSCSFLFPVGKSDRQ